LREKLRLRVYENRVLERIFWPKMEGFKGEVGKYFSGDKSRKIRWAGHVASMRVRRGVYRVLVGRPKGKRPLGRPRHR
jgi:hypothetical protein